MVYLDVASGSPSMPGTSAGFDLDGHVTASETDPAGCGWVDSVAPAAFGGYSGVDNQLGPLLEMLESLGLEVDVAAGFASALSETSIALLLRLSGVGDLVNDGRVHAELVDLTRSSPLPLADWPDAFIVGGRLHTGPAAAPTPFPLPALERTEPIRVERVSIDGLRFTAMLDPMVAYDAVFGGAVAVEPMVGYVRSISPDVMIPVETIRSILSGQADIDTNGDIYECEALSIAIVTEAVIR